MEHPDFYYYFIAAGACVTPPHLHTTTYTGAGAAQSAHSFFLKPSSLAESYPDTQADAFKVPQEPCLLPQPQKSCPTPWG